MGLSTHTDRAILHHLQTGAEVSETDVTVHVQQHVIWFYVPVGTENTTHNSRKALKSSGSQPVQLYIKMNCVSPLICKSTNMTWTEKQTKKKNLQFWFLKCLLNFSSFMLSVVTQTQWGQHKLCSSSLHLNLYLIKSGLHNFSFKPLTTDLFFEDERISRNLSRSIFALFVQIG